MYRRCLKSIKESAEVYFFDGLGNQTPLILLMPDSFCYPSSTRRPFSFLFFYSTVSSNDFFIVFLYLCCCIFFSRSTFMIQTRIAYDLIIIMILSLSIVIIAAVLGSVALFFLLGSNVAELKKQNILVIMGSLLLLAILISNFKSNDMFTFSLLNSSSKNKINSIFSSSLPAYNRKYNLDTKTLGDDLYDKNYASNSANKDYNECIIYLSNNDEGASFFLYQLTEKLRGKGYPAFYIKMQSPSGSSKQFFRKTGLPSYEAFKSAIDYYLQQKSIPYIIVDNAQLLPMPVWEILSTYDDSHGPSIILNTENGDMLFERINELNQAKLIKKSSNFLKRFQIQRFNGPDQAALQKLSPSNSFIKRSEINLKNIFNMKNGATEQEILLKSSTVNSNLANYFGLSNYYNQVKKLVERGPVQFGKLRQSGIPFEAIQQMERLNLVKLRNGQVFLE